MGNPGPQPAVTDDEILAVFRESDDAVLTAGEVARQLPITRRTVHDRLSSLHEQQFLERKEVGPHVVWWLVDETDERAAPAAPLRNLVGLVDEETAAQARRRSREWRDAFDDDIQAGDH